MLWAPIVLRRLAKGGHMKLHPQIYRHDPHHEPDEDSLEGYLRFLAFFWASLLTAYLLSLWT
jgi:hypothetical protein